MRTVVLTALIVSFAGCSSTNTNTSPYAKANTLMQGEIANRVANFEYQQGQELLNNMMWLETKAGETAIDSLLGALKHKDAKVRSSAVWVLGRINHKKTIPQLQTLLKDDNEVVRLESARALVVMGDLKPVPMLIAGLDSERTKVRYNCHMALRDSTLKDFDYDHLEEDQTARRAAVLRWREWWSDHTSDPWFAASYAKEHGFGQATATPTPAKPAGETQRVTETPQAGTTPTKEVVTPATPDQVVPKQATPGQVQPTVKTPAATTPKPTTTPKATTEKTDKTTDTADDVFKLLNLGSPTDGAKKATTPTKTTPKQPETTPTGTPNGGVPTPGSGALGTPKTTGTPTPKFEPTPDPKGKPENK